MGFFERLSGKTKTPPADKSVEKPAVVTSPVPVLTRPAASAYSRPSMGETPKIALDAGSITGFSLSDFPPGMGNMPSLPTRGGRADAFCDMCGKGSDHRYIDPIPVIATNPKNSEDRWFWNRALCAGCYSIRFEARYPGVTPVEIPD